MLRLEHRNGGRVVAQQIFLEGPAPGSNAQTTTPVENGDATVGLEGFAARRSVVRPVQVLKMLLVQRQVLFRPSPVADR